jgi:XRE family aerobic/anaerobic benzoate catabolism transcriptional regulator
MSEPEPKADLLAQVGLRILKARTKAGISRRLLSEKSGVSPRYIAQMEAGEGNISIALLQKVATALDMGIEWFFWPEDPWLSEFQALTNNFRAADDTKRTRALRILRSSQEGEHKSNRVCLIGLRGAGKSTLGQMVADDLDVPFIELNAVIAKEGGIWIPST